MGTAFFQRSELDLSALNHFSAGGQLLHPSEVKSSMSELCVSPLSNVVAGGVDPGCPANKEKEPAARKITRTQANFILSILRLPGSPPPATDALRRSPSF